MYNDSRGSEVLDTYMDGCEGGIIADGHWLYKRYDKGDKHQRRLRARNTRGKGSSQGALIGSNAGRRHRRLELYRDFKAIFEEVKWIAGREAHSAKAPRLHGVHARSDAGAGTDSRKASILIWERWLRG